MLSDIVRFRDGIFTEELLLQAQNAYQSLVNEKICNDLHSSSTSEIASMVDDILALNTYPEIKLYLAKKNPNLIAFLFARIQHFVHYLESLEDLSVQFLTPPKSVLRWGVVDFWNDSPPSSDRY
jgi:hypothetical protein